MSEKDFQIYIDKAVKAGKESQKSSTVRTIFATIAATLISGAIITFFSSFYGVKNAIEKVDTEFIEFKDDTEKEIVDMKIDITTNWNTNFTQEGRIGKLEGIAERGIKLDNKNH